MLSEFYNNTGMVSEKIDSSKNKFTVGVIGKHSIGKSMLLNKLFSDKIPFKGSDFNNRQNLGFHYENLNDFHLLDVNCFEDKNSDHTTDAFKFYAIMSLSNLILFNISHQDLENRTYIKNLSFLLFQCFNPFRSNLFKYKSKLPKIILLIRNPRWDNPSKETFDAFHDLVKRFQIDIEKSFSENLEEFILMLEDADVKNDKQNEENIKQKYETEKSKIPKFEFKIDKHYIIYFQEQSISKPKGSTRDFYYELADFGDGFDIRTSDFKNMKNDILNFKIDYDQSDFFYSEGMSNEMMKIMNEERSEKKRKSSIIQNVYADFKNNVFIKLENIHDIQLFFNDFYKIKAPLEKLSEQQIAYIYSLSLRSDFSREEIAISDGFESKVNETSKMFDKIEDLKNSDKKEHLVNYHRSLNMNSVLIDLSLNKENKDSLVFTTLFCMIYSDDQKRIKELLLEIKRQLILYEFICFNDEERKNDIILAFRKNFEFFEVMTMLFNEYLENITELCKDSDVFNHNANKILNNLFEENINNLLGLFEDYLGVNISPYKLFIKQCISFYKTKIDSISKTKVSQEFIENRQIVEIIKSETYIPRKSLPDSIYKTLGKIALCIFPVLVNLGIIAIRKFNFMKQTIISRWLDRVLAVFRWPKNPIGIWATLPFSLALARYSRNVFFNNTYSVKTKNSYSVKHGYEIVEYNHKSLSINGHLSNENCAITENKLCFTGTFNKDKDIRNSALFVFILAINIRKI